MSTANLGSRLLERKLRWGDQTKVAKEFGISIRSVQAYLTGYRKPRGFVRAELERVYSIPWDAWDQEIILESPWLEPGEQA